MKITKRQLRRIIKEGKQKLLREQQASPEAWANREVMSARPDPGAWANKHGGDVDRDEEGQTIIYLSKKDYPREEMIHEYLPREWDYEDTYDETSWVIYTGEYQ